MDAHHSWRSSLCTFTHHRRPNDALHVASDGAGVHCPHGARGFRTSPRCVGERQSEGQGRRHVLFASTRKPTIALKQADARLAGVGQTIGANTAAVAAAQERLIEAQAKREHIVEQSNRTLELVKKGVYSEARKDLVVKEIDVAEASVREADSELERARQELGPQGNDNPQFREALAAVEQAKLNLVRTTVVAPSDGVITNLQLADGEFVDVGHAALTFIDTADVWVNANFRENALENVKAGNPVELVLDTLPGRIYDAKVESIGWGVSQGSIDPETGLPKINEPMGLVRTPQRFAVKIEPNRQDYVPGSVRYGSQANVIVYASDNALVNAIGRLWMRIVAVLTYVS
jgi:multidrug resistance efflux pump